MVAAGLTAEVIMVNVPSLETGGIAEALRYIAEPIREHDLPLCPMG
jgi:hypothetical protein